MSFFSPPMGEPAVVHFKSGKTLPGEMRDAPDTPYFYLDTDTSTTYIVPWAAVEWVKIGDD